jgi:hypothetical protein
MGLSVDENLILDRYLMLQRGATLAVQNRGDSLHFFEDIPLREINIVVWLGEVLDHEEALESFCQTLIRDRFASWCCWILVAETEILEEVELYLALWEPQEEESVQNLEEFSDEATPSFGIAYIDTEAFLSQYEILSPRLDGICFLEPHLRLSDDLSTRFTELPQFILDPTDPGKTIVESLYESRRAKSHAKTAMVYGSYCLSKCNLFQCFYPCLLVKLK